MSVDKSKVLIQVQDLKKAFGANQVLDGISTEICQGEVVAIIGPSGSGKSTFLRSLNLLEVPTGGKILFEGTDITDPKVDINRHRQKIGMVFQQFNLFPHKTVKQNIMMAPVALKLMTKEEASKRADELLARVGLPDKANSYPDMLSGGQKQRIAIARAVINEPKVLLLDEPLGALDLKLRRQMQLELKRLQKQLGITFIYITHDQEEAINMSDRIGVMHEGILEQLGTPNEVYYQPQTSYVADFVGNANILHKNGETFAIRSENILMNGEAACTQEAVVVEKSFAGGQLRILFDLPDGQTLTASRYGIDNDLQPGQKVQIGWDAKDAVKVIDNDKDENHK